MSPGSSPPTSIFVRRAALLMTWPSRRGRHWGSSTGEASTRIMGLREDAIRSSRNEGPPNHGREDGSPGAAGCSGNNGRIGNNGREVLMAPARQSPPGKEGQVEPARVAERERLDVPEIAAAREETRAPYF